MNKDLLEIAKQFKNDCDKDCNHVSNCYYYYLVKNDGSIEYRETMPYIVTNVDTLVIVNEYGQKERAYYSGNTYTAYYSQCLCLSDNGDSESFTIGDWTLKFDGISFIWNEGNWSRLKLSKEGVEYLLLFWNYEYVTKYWHIVKMFMEAEDSKQLNLSLQPFIDSKEIKRENGYYRIMKY